MVSEVSILPPPIKNIFIWSPNPPPQLGSFELLQNQEGDGGGKEEKKRTVSQANDVGETSMDARSTSIDTKKTFFTTKLKQPGTFLGRTDIFTLLPTGFGKDNF